MRVLVYVVAVHFYAFAHKRVHVRSHHIFCWVVIVKPVPTGISPTVVAAHAYRQLVADQANRSNTS